MQTRENAADTDFEGILEEEVAADLKEIATISMGTEISAEDMSNITSLCDQVGRLNLRCHWEWAAGSAPRPGCGPPTQCLGVGAAAGVWVLASQVRGHDRAPSWLLQVIQLAEYRAQLYEYLKSRMAAIAPNLTVSRGWRDNIVAVQWLARWEPPYSTHMQPP